MSDAERAAFEVVKPREALPPAPVDDYLGELDRLIAVHDGFEQDQVVPAIASGTASRAVVQRVALELYYLGKWTTPELALLIANAPDAYAFTMDDSRHYRRWAQHFAHETGYLDHVRTKVELCRQLGLGDDDIRAYRPLPETIATTFTMLYYVRRSYEEGLAVLGYAGERIAAGSRAAKTLYEGLRDHYGVDVGSVSALASAEAGDRAADVFRLVAVTRGVQDRCREAIRNYLRVAETRVRAMNRWVG
jgi:hypothetical protein